MFRKCCLFGLLLLLLPSTVNASVLTVDSEGNGDFFLIQEAVNNAASGDRIVVGEGEYAENIIITKELVLISNSSIPDDVIIRPKNPSEDILSIQANNVTIAGFSLYGIDNEGYGISLNGSTGCDLEDNLISGCRRGILVRKSDRNKINGNFLKDSNVYGFFLVESNNNQLENNTIINQKDGIYLDSSCGNFLGNNSVGGCSEYGIVLKDRSFNNHLFANKMFDNKFNFGDGCGFNDVDESNHVNGKKVLYLNDVSDVLIDSSSGAGVVYCYNCINVTVKDIYVSNNLRGISFCNSNGISLYNLSCTYNDKGIYFSEVSDSVISNCVIQNNSFVGIYIGDSGVCLIEGNEIQDNDDGIYIDNSFGCEVKNNWITGSSTGILLGLSNNNLVIKNAINHNDDGISLYLSEDNKIDNNEFFDNIGSGVFLQHSFDNSIMRNNISLGDVGIRFRDSSTNNSVFDNFITNNDECFVGEENNNLYNNKCQEEKRCNYLSLFSPIYLFFVIIGAFYLIRSKK